MDSVKKEVFERGLVKGTLTRYQSRYKEEATWSSAVKLREILTRYEPLLDKFDVLQNEIEYKVQGTELEAQQAAEREKFERDYLEHLVAIKTRIEELTVSGARTIETPQTQHTDNTDPTRRIRLPEVKLPTFDGDYGQWAKFRDTFDSLINSNHTLSNVEKFHYLNSALQGAAARTIQALGISEASYPLAWQELRERYEDKKLLVNHHLQSIINAKIIRESHTALRQFRDDIQSHILSLKAIGKPIRDLGEPLLVHLIYERLDDTSKREWDKAQVDTPTEPTVKDILDFLERRSKFLERRPPIKYASVKGLSHKPTYNLLKPRTETIASPAVSQATCPLCQGTHGIKVCELFTQMNPRARVAKIQELRACFNCLGHGHRNRDCKARGCKRCNRKHHSLLHIEETASSESEGDRSQAKGQASREVQACFAESIDSYSYIAILSTAIVHTRDKNGRIVKLRALLDSGSQSNLISDKAARLLGLGRRETDARVIGIGQVAHGVQEETSLKIWSHTTNYKRTMDCLVLNKSTADIPQVQIPRSAMALPKDVKLADPGFDMPRPVDLIIGVTIFWEILAPGQRRLGLGQPTLQETQLGWVITGQVGLTKPTTQTTCHVVTNEQLDGELKRFWEIDHSIGTRSTPALDDKHPCEAHFRKFTTRNPDGRYCVRIPVTDRVADLGESRTQTEGRLQSLEKRFSKDPELARTYKAFMREYEDLGHMELASQDNGSRAELAYYMPHQAVWKKSSTTTSLRVVFDGSAKTSTGLSVNDVQLVGPPVQSDLMAILTRFRTHNYVLSADIAKMFRQIEVAKEDRRLQRILWREQPDQPIREYELKTVTYGTASAPFLATRVLRELGEELQKTLPEAGRTIIEDFYVDDLVTGADTPEAIKLLKGTLQHTLEGAGMTLRKWASNAPGIVDPQAPAEQVYFQADRDPKTLGLLWDPRTDTLGYSPLEARDPQVTKRTVLSQIAKIFDPLGLIGPLTVRGKLLMQQAWQLNSSWDDMLPPNLVAQWRVLYDDLQNVETLHVPRQAAGKITEIHGFCDASEKAYGACIFLKTQTPEGGCTSRLLCAKSRVAPLKQVSLPRLELCGALLLAQLVQKVRDALRIQGHREIYWTDSTVALAWIRGPPSKYQTFVANRISQIQDLCDGTWRHVPTHDNPADIISRGAQTTDLVCSRLWWDGPNWLAEEDARWPAPIGLDTEPPESRRVCLTAVCTDQDLFKRYSRLRKLIRVIAYCIRFATRTRTRSSTQPKPADTLSAEELRDAEDRLVKMVQEEAFSDEMRDLGEGREVSGNSKIKDLRPFLDDKGIIRVGGRLENAPLPYESRHPALLPASHPFTAALIREEHERLLHAGTQAVMASIRRRFWPLRCKEVTRRIIHQCVKCFRANPRGINPVMGNLPADRVTPSRAFSRTGIDYAGPFFIKDKPRSRTAVKTYVCVFVCLATKAVHIELATDLSTEAFMNCLRRFISRRGLCQSIISDNGTNFMGARNQLREIGALLADRKHRDQVRNYLADRQVEWRMIPPRAPHFGGLWEGAVKSIKYHLRRIIGETKLLFEELYTVLTQVEAILNSRPISPLSTDPQDLAPLTPGHFLIGGPITAFPEPDLREERITRLSRFQLLQQMVQHFWDRWTKEYLHTLQQRNKWARGTPSTTLADRLVVIRDDNLPPFRWKLGRIVQEHPGQDGVTRVVSLRTAEGIIRRPVVKICLLPTDNDREGLRPITNEQNR